MSRSVVAPLFKLVGRQLKRLALNLDVRPRVDEPLLERAILHVVRGHVGEEHDEHIVVVFDRGIEFGIGRFDRAAVAAPEIEFPGSGQPGIPIGKPG